ncbi:hypothetical protein AAG906_005508 [Vitis piasezkii]
MRKSQSIDIRPITAYCTLTLQGGSIKETMGRLISKFFIYDSVAPNKANSHHFKNMIIGAQQAGMGIEPPSPYEIKNKYLEMEYKDMEAYVNQQREKWKTYGCTIMSDGWTGPTRLSIINFMVYSKGSTVFLKSVDASNNIKDHKYIYKLLKNVIKEVGVDNVVQIVTDNGSAFVKAGKLLMKKFNLYWTPCAAHCIDLMFEDIGKRPSTAEVIRNARKITNFIYNHCWLLAEMRKYCGGDIVRPGATRADLKKLFMSDEWALHKLSRTNIGRDIEKLMFTPIGHESFDHLYWDRMKHVVSYFEPLYVVLRIIDSKVVPTMSFVYELMQVMKENLNRQQVGDWIFKILKDRWEKTLKHPLHAAVHEVFAKLDPNAESVGQFGNERGFSDQAAVASRSTMVPAEWWFMYGNQTPTLRNLAIKVLSQTASSSACERNWSTFALIHTKQRNRLAYSRLQQLVFCYYNMKLKLRDMEAENDRVAEKDYLDLLDISAEVGEEEENQLFQWVRPIHLDDEVEVHSESFSKDTEDSFQGALNSHQEVDSTSIGQSSRPSVAVSLSYDGSRGGIVDGSDHAEEILGTPTKSISNESIHLRAGPGIGAIGKPYKGRERTMTSYNEELLSGSFESMSMGTQFSDSSNEANVYPPYVMGYGQPSSSTDEKYVPYQMQGGFDMNTWVNLEYPIHVEAVGRTQEIYAWHVRIFNQYYRGSMSWYQYCLQQRRQVPSSTNSIEQHRSSFWY